MKLKAVMSKTTKDIPLTGKHIMELVGIEREKLKDKYYSEGQDDNK